MMNYIKRRFSSTELNDDDARPSEHQSPAGEGSSSKRNDDLAALTGKMDRANLGLTNAPKVRKNPSPSAPTSPTRAPLSITGMMSVAKDLIATTATNVATTTMTYGHGQSQQSTPASVSHGKSNTKKKHLLIIDHSSVEWAKYFKNRKIGDYEIRIEQAEFKDINLASYVDSGTIVDIIIDKEGTKVMRSFKPDFVLIRQHVKNLTDDWTNIVIGLGYGLIPSVNSLESVYNFRDKPWVFSKLVQIAKKHGTDAFPIINQTYYPNYKEMVRTSFPCIVKVGHAHDGLGKIQIKNPLDFQDITSIVSIANTYTTTEPYFESKCDIHIQKIGSVYKAYMKKSITGNWKSNVGSSMLEQIPVNDRYKFWIDEVSKVFGGLDICTVQAIVDASTDKEYIIDVCDSSFTLLGESLDTDRKLIADLVMDKMMQSFLNHNVPNVIPKSSSSLSSSSSSTSATATAAPAGASHTEQSASNPPPVAMNNSHSSNSSETPAENNQLQQHAQKPNVRQNPRISSSSHSIKEQTQANNFDSSNSMSSISSTQHKAAAAHPPLVTRAPPMNANNRSVSNIQPNVSTTMRKSPNDPTNANNNNPLGKKLSSSSFSLDDAEDTMNNLRKTFAGIFGNSNI